MEPIQLDTTPKLVGGIWSQHFERRAVIQSNFQLPTVPSPKKKEKKREREKKVREGNNNSLKQERAPTEWPDCTSSELELL
jgi:hypothetical protein